MLPTHKQRGTHQTAPHRLLKQLPVQQFSGADQTDSNKCVKAFVYNFTKGVQHRKKSASANKCTASSPMGAR